MAAVILVIDDDTDDRALVAEAIREIDPSVICYLADGGNEGLNTLAAMGNSFSDLILLDINMPLMNGWECLAQLKEHTDYSSIPVIMYSTSAHIREKESARRSGALELVAKPFGYTELKRLLADILMHVYNNTLQTYTGRPVSQ